MPVGAITIKATGFGNLDKIIDQMERYVAGFKAGALRAQYEEAVKIATLSRDTYCPIDTGRLRGTFRVVADLTNPDIAQVSIMVGGAGSAAPYAAIVHERLDVHHQSPTQAKFLERAVNELAPRMTVAVGEEAVRAAKATAS
jgi:hypothetical protein